MSSHEATPSEHALEVDVAVIGAGSAGLAAYRAAVTASARVLLVEAGPHGTTCARVGCMPSKLLVAAAEAAHDAREAGPFGVHAAVRIDGREVMARVRRERDRFVGFVVDGVERIPEEHLVHGRAAFVAPGLLEVGGRTIAARAVVVATGSAPVVPSMFEAVRDRLVVNDDIFSWTDLPQSVAVFGAGVIGLELGQALHRLGVRVRIFGRGGALGPITDPVVRHAALSAFSSELPVDLDASVLSVTRAENGAVEVTYRHDDGAVRVETFELALVAAGRRARVEGLGLERAGVELDPRTGGVVVDRLTLRAGRTNIFVAGDANYDIPLLHEATDEGTIAGENASRYPDVRRGHRRSPLSITFSDPQLATVGSRWAELAARGEDDFVVGSVDFGDQGRSRVIRKNRGKLRVYAARASGRLLGAEMAGPRAEHLAHLLAWSHQQGLGVADMLAMPFYHPVVEEGLRAALRDAHGKLRALPPAA